MRNSDGTPPTSRRSVLTERVPWVRKPRGLIPQSLFELGPTEDGYQVNAVPQKFGSSGRRSFYSDQTLVIRHSWTKEAATANSPPIE